MINWWATSLLESRGPGFLVVWCFWVIGSVVLHELAHGVAAIRAGDRTPIETGHMTWNPLVHTGTSGLIMFALMGVTWGFMPVNPSRFRGRYDDTKVALAGPTTNLVLALVAATAAGVMVALDRRGVLDLSVGDWPANLFHCFFLGASLNLVLFALNMLPIPPLDGSRILGNFSRGYREMIEQPQVSGASMVVLVLIFFFGGEFLYTNAELASRFLMEQIAGLIA